jgi:hypothetical protein
VEPSRADLDQATVQDVADLATDAMHSLAGRADPDAFAQLLRLSQLAGECLGMSARELARHQSWSGVADMAGTTRQAAWSRWRQP